MELPRQTKLAQLGLACSSPTQSPEERATLQILSSMLSSGQSSILRRRLVFEHELTHRLRVVLSDFREAGMFLTTFSTPPTKVPVALSILTETVHNLKKDSSKFKQRFQVARNHALGSVSTGIDTQLMWRAIQGAWETLRRGNCSWDEKLSSLKSLSFEQFTNIVMEILRPERIALILAGQFKEGITDSAEW
jgi:predicted Zn-dependent peptidase